MAQIVGNNFSAFAPRMTNNQLTTLLALCDSKNVVQPVQEAFEDIMLLQQPIAKQIEIEELQKEIKVTKALLGSVCKGTVNYGPLVLQNRKLRKLETKLQNIQDECFRGKPSTTKERDHWQTRIRNFLQETFGMHTKARTAFILQLTLRNKN